MSNLLRELGRWTLEKAGIQTFARTIKQGETLRKFHRPSYNLSFSEGAVPTP
jgi:hypothetical protein